MGVIAFKRCVDSHLPVEVKVRYVKRRWVLLGGRVLFLPSDGPDCIAAFN